MNEAAVGGDTGVVSQIGSQIRTNSRSRVRNGGVSERRVERHL